MSLSLVTGDPQPTERAIPLVLIPAALGGIAARLRGSVLYLDPLAPRDDLLRAIRDAAVFLATGDPGTARVNRPRLQLVTA